MYNGGYTDDLRRVLEHIQKKLAPGTPLVGIGFSLGSNILVKVCNIYRRKVRLLTLVFKYLVLG
jgi:predicted alpha/beta-fold hydrolase